MIIRFQIGVIMSACVRFEVVMERRYIIYLLEKLAHFAPNETIRSTSRPIKALLKDSIAINSTAFEVQDKSQFAFIGSKTESALLDFAHTSLSMGPVSQERSNSDVVYLVPFDSGRKYMATMVRTDNGFRIYAKGAAEVMLGRCIQIIKDAASDAAVTAITPEDKTYLNHVIENFATRSLRTIALLYRDIDTLPLRDGETIEEYLQTGFDGPLKDMTLLAIVGIQEWEFKILYERESKTLFNGARKQVSQSAWSRGIICSRRKQFPENVAFSPRTVWSWRVTSLEDWEWLK
jgi:hypothetical protein